MQLQIDAEVYEKFVKLKEEKDKKHLSDSEFIMLLLTHMESYGNEVDRFTFSNGLKRRHVELNICPECKYVADSMDGLCDHFETEHAEDGSFSCTCGLLYSRLPNFLRHYIECPVAATDLEDPHAPVKRSNSVTGVDGTRNSYDEVLDASPPELYHSYRHPSVSPIAGPSDDKPYGCPKCFKGFKSKSLLDQHMHLHYPPRYKCRWCGNVYRWPPVYYHHKQKCKKRPSLNGTENHDSQESTAPDDLPFKLEDSAVSNEHVALAQQTLAQFMNLHGVPLAPPDYPVDIPPLPVPSFSDGIANSPFTCFCSENFPNVLGYLEHVTTCPRVLSASGLDNFLPQPYGLSRLGLDLSASAPENDRSMSVAEDLSSTKGSNAQISQVNGIFRCSICRKEFNSKLSLKQHVDGKHRAEGKYLCPTCGKRYRWGASFYYHKKTCVASESHAVVASPTAELLTTHT